MCHDNWAPPDSARMFYGHRWATTVKIPRVVRRVDLRVFTVSEGLNMSSVTPTAGSLAPLPDPSPIVEHPYAYEAAAVLQAYGSSEEGLAADTAAARLAEVGWNALPQVKPESPVRRFLRQMDDVLIYILLPSAALKAIIGDWVDFGVILAVALLNGVIGFVQEGRAEKALEGIAKMLSSSAAVRRDGDWQEVAAEDLVPGDVIRVHAGDRVPADARLLSAANLQVEESALTGEAVSSTKRVDPVTDDAGVGDRDSMLFSSTIVTSGQGTAVVTATGTRAEIGRIQQLMSEVEQFDTPLTRPGHGDGAGGSIRGQWAETSTAAAGSRPRSGRSLMVKAITNATAMNGTATRNTSSIAWVKAVSTQVLTGSVRAWMAVMSFIEVAAAPSWLCACAGTTSAR
jgi:magnesium-transporting ATPase (P-type)